MIPSQISLGFDNTYGITPRTIPYVLAGICIVFGVLLIIQSLVLKKDEVKTLDVGKELKALGYMAVILIYALLFKKSFLVSTMFLGVATLAFTGSKKKSFYVIVLAAVLILYLLFSKVLHVQLP